MEVTGLSRDALRALQDADLTAEQWSAVLRVAVDDAAPGMLGTYSVADQALRFTPLFPLDPGPSVSGPLRSRASPGARRRRRGRRRSSPASGSRRSTHAVDGRWRACIRRATSCRRICCACTSSSRGRWARPSGIQHMKLLDEAGQGDPRCVPAARLRVLEPRSHALHGVLRSGPREGRDSAEPADGARAEVRAAVTLVISREWRDRAWAAAEGRVQARAARWPCRREAARHRVVAHRAAAGGRAARRPRRHVPRAARPWPADAGARRHPRRHARRGRHRRRQTAKRGGCSRRASRGAPAPITCSRSTSSRTSPAIRSAARSRSTTSIPSTRVPIRKVS